MSARTWGIVGAVVVLAAAGTTAALLLRGGEASDRLGGAERSDGHRVRMIADQRDGETSPAS
jgi:hypothetical protein